MKSASERYAALVRLVESRTVTRAQPALLLPAGPYFDLAGEEFGRNLLTAAGRLVAAAFARAFKLSSLDVMEQTALGLQATEEPIPGS